MTIRKIEKLEKIVSHPLEDFLNIESGTTEIVKYARKTELQQYGEFDDKDKELEDTYQEILDAAMTGYDTLNDLMDTADTKFVARLAEVSVQHLNVALAAASKKTSLKENKDKLLARAKTGGAKNLNQTIVFAGNRNDILRDILQHGEVLEGEIVTPAKELKQE